MNSYFLTKIDNQIDIKNEEGKKVGKVCATLNNHGLGLLRIENCMKAQDLKCENNNSEIVNVNFEVPAWWPKTAPKTPQNR